MGGNIDELVQRPQATGLPRFNDHRNKEVVVINDEIDFRRGLGLVPYPEIQANTIRFFLVSCSKYLLAHNLPCNLPFENRIHIVRLEQRLLDARKIIDQTGIK